MDQYLGSKRQKLFIVLLIIQIVTIIMQILAGEFMESLPRTMIRFVFLLVANFCMQMNFAIFYSVFTVFSALFMVDPVGLFITGHGDKKTTVQNVFCILVLVLSLGASYLGYLYAKEIQAQSLSAPPNDYSDNYDNYQSFSRPINRPSVQPNNDQPQNSYGGTNYFYQNPRQSNPNPSNPQPHRSQFQPFSGQGYSLE